MAVLTDNQTQASLRRIRALGAWESPTLGAIAGRRLDAALAAHADELDRLWSASPQRALIAQRTVELEVSPEPTKARLCWHHIDQARDDVDELDRALGAPLKGLDRDLFGNERHRVKMLKRLPEVLRRRLDPVFVMGVLPTDATQAAKLAFDGWAAAHAAGLAPLKARKDFFPAALGVYNAHRPALVGLLDELLALFHGVPGCVSLRD